MGHTLRNSFAFKNAKHGITDNGNPGALALTGNTTFRNSGTGFDADTSGAVAVLTRNLSVADGKAAALGTGTVADGNSWNLGGTWNEASVLSTDTGAVTGARAADGSVPSAPDLFVPRNGAAVGARM